MTPRTTRLVAALVAIVAAISACTTTAGGTPHPATDGAGTSSSATTTSETTTSTKSEAPRVTNPLDASAFVAAPCSSLTPTQLNSFEVNPPGDLRKGEGINPGCGWHGSLASISVGWIVLNEGGLSDTYRGRELEAYFIETTVDGYPAVFVDRTDGRSSGRCGIVVGVSETLTFYAVDNSHLDADAACARAEQIAAATIATVKAGS